MVIFSDWGEEFWVISLHLPIFVTIEYFLWTICYYECWNGIRHILFTYHMAICAFSAFSHWIVHFCLLIFEGKTINYFECRTSLTATTCSICSIACSVSCANSHTECWFFFFNFFLNEVIFTTCGLKLLFSMKHLKVWSNLTLGNENIYIKAINIVTKVKSNKNLSRFENSFQCEENAFDLTRFEVMSNVYVFHMHNLINSSNVKSRYYVAHLVYSLKMTHLIFWEFFSSLNNSYTSCFNFFFPIPLAPIFYLIPLCAGIFSASPLKCQQILTIESTIYIFNSENV